jgi:hypothetical protein
MITDIDRRLHTTAIGSLLMKKFGNSPPFSIQINSIQNFCKKVSELLVPPKVKIKGIVE